MARPLFTLSSAFLTLLVLPAAVSISTYAFIVVSSRVFIDAGAR